MNRPVRSTEEVDFLFDNRDNLSDFHYFTDDERIYDYFCEKVAKAFGLEEDPKLASNISDSELRSLNAKYKLNLKTAYLNGPKCDCGRQTNGYDFIVNAIYKHGAGFLRGRKLAKNAKFIMPFRRAFDAIVCTDCGTRLPLAAGTWYSDSSDIDTYGPCCD